MQGRRRCAEGPWANLSSLHAPEVECIDEGKAHKPYEFGVKVSVATTVNPSKGGPFVLQAEALPVVSPVEAGQAEQDNCAIELPER